MTDKKITIGLDFDFNLAQLNNLKDQLDDIRLPAVTQKNISAELREAGEAAKFLKNALDDAWNPKLGQLDLSKLNKIIKDIYGDIGNLKKSLSGAGITGDNVFDNFSKSVLKTNVQIKQTNKLLDSMATSMSNTIKWGITSSVFNNISGSIQKAWDYSLKLDSSLNDIRIVTGKSADEMERFAKVANASAKDLRASTLDYTQAALIYYQQGLGESEVQARAETTLKVANVTGQSGQAVSEQLTAVWNGYKVAAEESELYIDKLSAVAATTAADLEELSTGMSKVASAANAMGVDIDQLNAQLATIISVTRAAPESVGTSLKTIYARMGDIEAGIEEDGVTLGDYTEEMAEMGVHVLNAKGELRDMGEVIEEVGNNWNNFTREQQIALAQTMAGTRQYNNLIALFDSWEMYKDALNSSKNSAGELQKQQDIYMESTEAYLQRLATEAEETYDILFDDTAVKTMTASLTGLLSVFNSLLAGTGGGLSSLTFLGANAINLFSGKIGQGISQSVTNRKKINQEKSRKSFIDDVYKTAKEESSSSYVTQKIGQGVERTFDKGFINLFGLYSDMQDQLTESEQKETYNLVKRISIRREEIKLLDKYLATMKDFKSDFTGIIDEESFTQILENYNTDAFVKDFVKDFNDKLKKENKSLIENGKKVKIIDSVRFKAPEELMKELRKRNIGDKIDLDVHKLVGLFNQTSELKEEDLSFIFNQIAAEKSFLETMYKEHKGQEKNLYDLRQGIAKERAEQLGGLTSFYLDKMETKQISAAISGVSSLTVVLTGLSGILKTVNNDSLTTNEIIGQIAITTLASIPHLFNFGKNLKDIGKLSNTLLISFAEDSTKIGFKNFEATEKLGTTLKSLLQSEVVFGEKAVKALRNSEKAATGLSIKLGALLGWITLITAAVGALAYVWWKEENAAKHSLEAAKKQTQSLKESFEELTEKADSFRASISNYQEGINSLKELDSTTEEYKNTLSETNKKAKELIESLKLYNNFTIGKGGEIQISPEVLADLQFKLDLQAANAESAFYASEILANKKQQEYDLKEIADKIPMQHVWKEGWFGTNVGAGNMPVYLQEDELSKIIEAIREIKNTDGEKGLIKYTEIMDSAESLQNFIETTYAGEEEIRVFADEIGKCVYSIDKYIESTDAATEANKYDLQQIIGLDVEKRYGAILEKMAQDNTGKVDKGVYEQLKYIISNSETQKNAQSGLERDLQKGLTTAEAWSDEINFRAVGEKNWNSQIGAYLKEYYNLNVQDIFGSDLRDTEEMAKAYAKYVKGFDLNELDTKGNALVDKQGTEVVKFGSKKERGEIRSGLYNFAFQNYAGEIYQKKAARDTEEYINTINNLISNANAAGNKYGVDWTEGLLSALSNPEQEFDLSSTFTTLNPDEVKEIQAMTPEQLMKMLGVTEETIKQAGFDSVEIFAENFKQGFKNHRYSISEDIAQAMAEKAKEFEAIGEDLSKKQLEQYQEDVQIYAKNLMQIAGEEGTGVGEALKYDAEMAVDFALKVVKMNKAIESLAENFKDWNSILKKSKSSSQEYAEAMEGIKTAIADVYDVSSDYISHDFINENLPEIEKIAKGDEVAIENLRNELAQELIFNIGINNGLDETGAQEQVDKFKGLKEQIQEVLNDNPEMGVDLDTSSFIDGLQEIVTNTNMNIGQVQDLFSSLGLEPIYETEMVDQTQTNPIIETTTAFSGFNKITLPDGTERWGATTTQVSKQVGTESFTTQVPILSASYDGKPPKIVGAKKLPHSSVNNYSKVNTGGPSLNSGGSKSKPKKKDKIEDSVDRYHDINLELKKVSNQLKDVQDETEKLTGADLINNLTHQYELLNEEITLTKQKIAEVEEEINGTEFEKGLKDKLAAQKVEFNLEDGTIANYEQIVQEKEDYVNSLIEKYTAMTVEEQEAFEETLANAEKDFKEFQDDIKRYDELISEEIPSLEEEIQGALNEQIEINIQKFNMEIELRIETSEAERDWNEFKKKVIDNIDEDDILGNAKASLQDFHSYYKDGFEGVLQVNTDHVNDILFELREMDRGVASEYYGDNRVKALEDLKTYYKQLMEDLTAVNELSEEVRQSYLDMMDEAQAEFDKQIASYEQITNLIDHDLKLLELLGGEKNYKAFGNYYNKQVENNKEQLDFQRQQLEFWQEEMRTAEEGTERWEKAKENVESTTLALRETVNKSIEDAQAKYLNAIKIVFEELNNEITNGKGLEYIKEEWDLITKNSEKYLDNINAAYGIEQLRNKYQEAIDNNDSLSAQAKLNDLMTQELAALEEKDKLTEYDIERANKRYEIALKQIALEEAQQNKTSMRLKRDSQGNYSYVFAADEDAVSKAEDELADAQNALYNFDKENYLNNLDELYAAYEEYQEKMLEAAQINDPNERLEKEKLLEEEYGKLINGLVEQNQNIRSNLYESAFEELARLQDKNVESFKNMTQTQKDALMNDLIPQWESGVQQMADKFAGDGGLEETCKGAMQGISEATQQYKTDLEEVKETSGLAFDKIEQGIDTAITDTQKLIENNDDLIKKYENELTAIDKVITELDILIAKFAEAEQAAKDAAEAAYYYTRNEDYDSADAAFEDRDYSLEMTRAIVSGEDLEGEHYTSSARRREKKIGGMEVKVDNKRLNNLFAAYIAGDEEARFVVMEVYNGRANYTDEFLLDHGFNTGGYTGSWSGNDGRLALLHQKELVLNADDTKNILNAVQVIRSIENSLFKRITDMANIGVTSSTIEKTETFEQNVYIDAQFPNATSSKEIENAFNNLLNTASQRVHSK